MTRTLVRLRWPLVVGLAIAVVVAPARSDGPTKPDTRPDKQQIDDLEKQIADLKKKLDEMKKAPGTAPTTAPTLPAGTLPAAVTDQFKWRGIGPANMGGRVTALAVYEADPSIYYVATGGGGLLKTVNNGTTFVHQFDKQSTVAIGDVAVCQTNPDIVWVGTGEANPRNSVSYGDGVYKSTDGGKTWTNMGLRKSFQIGKILIHPKNPDVVYVGALGRLYGANEERGMFKTTDGGKTWTKVLYTDDKTGVIDARLDPNDPETLIVAQWERKRDEFDGFFGEAPVPDSYGPIVTHGAGGGLWKSADGGKTWKKLTGNGLPTVKTGRIGLDYSRKTKGLIYAIIDTEKVGTGEPIRAVFLGIVGGDNTGGGAKIEEITDAGPAQKAGLKANDVVVKVGDKKIENYEGLLEIIRAGKAGDKLKFTVKRDGKETEIEVTLANRPEAEPPTRGGGGRAQGGGRGQGGAAATRPLVGVTFGEGTTINGVSAGGAAEKAGIKAGSAIVAVDGKEVKTADEFRAAIGDDKKAGDTVKLTVKTGDATKVVDIVLQAPPAAPAQATGGRLMPGFAPELNFQATEVKVGTVAAGGAAEKAGIKVGDIVLEVDGKKVENFRDFLTALRTGQNEDNPRKAGDTVKVKVKQADKTLDVVLALAEMQVPGMGGGGPTRGANTRTPYGLGLGGQQPNMQDRQGKDSFQTGGVFVSADNGETWKRVNSLNPRPMYFSVVRVDPTDDKIVYVLADTPTPMYRSTDGGKSFSILQTAGGVHADAHALWVSPHNGGKQLIIGCDGGFYTTFDKGATWEHLNHFALGQFYHVAVDNRKPYRVYGGLQDNGSWGGPSNSRRSYGPVNEDWVFVSGGDGFVCRVDPTDPDLIYTESQGGAIGWRNLRTGARGFARASAGQNAPPYRFNWNTPYILSSANPSIFYSAGDFVFKSIKKGADLKKISPDITRTKAGSATALAESPANPDVLWAGTDDGFVWVTQDGGQTWTNVTENIKAAGLPGYRCVATLEANKEKAGRCYVALDGHRSDDDKPYLFVTEDFGKTWKSIASNLPTFGSTRCLREDITTGNVLYCGTEFGAWVSVNRGASWSKLGSNLPTVACHEFAQPTTAGDLVVATHGRSVWVVDITSLRQMSAEVVAAPATLFTPATATRWRNPEGAESPYSRTDKRFVGDNPARGTSLDYFLGKPAKAVTLKVMDVAGKTVAEVSSESAGKTVGLHRVAWGLTRGTIGAQRAGGRGQGGGGGGGGGQFGGAGVAAGTYRLVLNVDGTETSYPLTIELDPNAPKDMISLEEEEAQREPTNPLKAKRIPLWIDN